MPRMTDRSSASDLDLLLVQVASGDRNAFAALYRAIGPKVKGYLVKQTRDPALSEELVQDVLLTVWRKAGTYDPKRANATTWIFTIARNRMLDRLRKQGRPLPEADDPHWVPAPAPPADGVVEALQRTERVEEALAKLPEAQQEVLRLTFYECRSYPEIATTLDVALGTVKSRARLAFQRLRTLLVEDA